MLDREEDRAVEERGIHGIAGLSMFAVPVIGPLKTFATARADATGRERGRLEPK